MYTTSFTLAPLLLLLSFSLNSAKTDDLAMYKSLSKFRECFGKKEARVCLKEKTLNLLDDTIMSDKPIVFYDMINIERNPNFNFNTTEEDNLPQDVEARSSKLSDILYDKVEEFFKSRVIKFNMAAAASDDEGRAKKDKGGKGGMMMMMMGGMACMMAQLFMGKVAFMAGTALILAKVALFMSAIIGLKKLSGGGGGGETSHVVYASSSDGHSHGGGGWHRSLSGDAQPIVYSGYQSAESQEMNNYGY